MRTKTLLLIAAVGAASAATSMAQVYSVNAVGYVNTKVPAGGFSMVTNPLNAATNTINALFAGVPDGFQVYAYANGKYTVLTFDSLDNSFGTLGDTTTLLPGGGVFVKAPKGADVPITFVGEVPQGTLTTPLAPGFQIVSSKVPQGGTATQLQVPGLNGDQIYQFDSAKQSYIVSTFDDLDNKYSVSGGSTEPTFGVGEAFWFKATKAETWTRTFSVNP